MQPCGLRGSTDHGSSLSPSIAAHRMLHGPDRAEYYFVHLGQLTTLPVRCPDHCVLYRFLLLCVCVGGRDRGGPSARGERGAADGVVRGGCRQSPSTGQQGKSLRIGHGGIGIWHFCVPSSVLDQEHGTAARARTRWDFHGREMLPRTLPPRSKQAGHWEDRSLGGQRRAVSNREGLPDCVL